MTEEGVIDNKNFMYKWNDMMQDLTGLRIPSNIKFVHGIPRGGSPIASYISSKCDIPLLDGYGRSDDTLIVDDICDSGQTMKQFEHFHKVILVMKEHTPTQHKMLNSPRVVKNEVWVHFPWEHEKETVEDNIIRLLTYIGEDPNREGLRDTPKRVIKSYEKLFGGYKQDEAKILERRFDAENYDQMIVVSKIDFFSFCEHHMLPFFGTVDVGYIPKKGKDGRIVGLSKIPRVVEVFSRRLQNQERLGQQIADAIQKSIDPVGVGVIISAKHFCMMSRGVEKQNAEMKTSALRGIFYEQPVRQEFLELIRK